MYRWRGGLYRSFIVSQVPGDELLTVLSPRSLLDQLRRLQAMVIQISNKTSSSSSCVLVRMVMEEEILVSQVAGTWVQSRALLHLLFLCSRSYCSPSVSSLYLLCTPRTQGGACQLSMEVRGLMPLRGVQGEKPGLLLKSLFLLSVIPPASCPP